MDQVIDYRKSYKEYKAELDGVLQRTAEGFVKIGYLLKVARDTNVLAESGYKTVAEFAKAEYNLDKDKVSRFIGINDNFSEFGYSDHLRPEFVGFGYAKLSLMLQLPDSVNEALSPGYSKAEINAIREEVVEERKVSDLEVAMENPAAAYSEETLLTRVIRKLGEDDPEMFVKICSMKTKFFAEKYIKEIMAPQGVKTYSARVPGVGRIILMLNDQSECRLVNSRNGEKEIVDWLEITEEWIDLTKTDKTPEEHWSELYCQPFPKKAEVAPVQPSKEVKKEPKKESKVVKAKTEKPKPATKPQVKEPEPVAEEQVPEQTSIEEDFKEMLPAPVEDVRETTEIAAAIQEDAQKKISEQVEKVEGEVVTEDTVSVAVNKDAKIHQIRLSTEFFDDAKNGLKTFELRKNDRDYKVGDILEMMEFDDEKYTGRTLRVLVIYLLENYTGIENGYCIMSTKLID